MRVLFASSRSCSVLLDEGGDYRAAAPYRLMLDGSDLGSFDRSVASLYGLTPGRAYRLEAWRDGARLGEAAFTTERETASLSPRRFGAAGDGVGDDTAALQAAILCCPEGGRVVLDRGDYRTGPLFLKSHMTLELKKGATLRLLTDRRRFPVLPGMIDCPDGGELPLGSWEGNPLDCFASALTGIGVRDVRIIGEGTVDGCAQMGDWWIDPKVRRVAYRGSLLFLRDCEDVTVQGLTFKNSPSWNLHPMFSRNLSFIDIDVEAPADSPNTDGFDPESCAGVRLYGARISVGDDCVALKSGKLYMGRRYRQPCEDVEIAWCAMLDGHGGVTVGSELSGGVRGVWMHHCLMRGNDRGLRIKTRRGRGRDADVRDIRFEDVRMESVKCPLVINALYFCDPDGHSARVQSREALPVDDTTPSIGPISFTRVRATDCQACVGYALGLPERPVERLELRDCDFDFAPDARGMAPAMADGVETCLRRGLIARNVARVILTNVTVAGVEGDALTLENVGTVEENG